MKWLIVIAVIALLLCVGKAALLAKRYRARSFARGNPYAYEGEPSNVLGRIRHSELMATQ